MIQFDLPKQKSSIIKVLGIGGGGSNAVNYMFAQQIEGVDFIICNTDSKALEQSRVPNKIQLGPHLTQGLGAGANPEVGKQATEESLEEIKRILEVNTKMAFITAGMGGGTGTGGAPIIAKICRELEILTVGIVTTPFGFEGPRRHQQAEAGIKQLEPYVDTLLVLSNDKLRIQYGNLKMKEAFGKADNVLATAAKCITYIINSRGHIIVDFSDVCTVMKNGGVAILGSSAAEGENRAQKAIEEALNSPLLNDNDIRGAKWVLININSAEDENECTMDELEIINNHLRMQAGENTDFLVGMGYDNTLDKKISITLIATGFDHKDPFAKKEISVKQPVRSEEKIVMTLGVAGEEKKLYNQRTLFEESDPFAPTLVEENESVEMQVITEHEEKPIAKKEAQPAESNYVLRFELSTDSSEPMPEAVSPQAVKEELVQPVLQYTEKPVAKNPVISGGYLSRPTNIYAENLAAKQSPQTIRQQQAPAAETIQPKEQQKQVPKQEQPDENIEFKLVMKEEALSSDSDENATSYSSRDLTQCEEEDQRRRAAERLHKLRNLSFNMNAADGNNEFENVPAYVRRNMELFGNTLASVESFYSKYTVNKEENEQGEISTINTFLDGKKPD